MTFYIGMNQMIHLHGMMDAQCIVNVNIAESILCKIAKEIGLNAKEETMVDPTMTNKEVWEYMNKCPFYQFNYEIANHYKIDACLYHERPLDRTEECKICNGSCPILVKINIIKNEEKII